MAPVPVGAVGAVVEGVPVDGGTMPPNGLIPGTPLICCIIDIAIWIFSGVIIDRMSSGFLSIAPSSGFCSSNCLIIGLAFIAISIISGLAVI